MFYPFGDEVENIMNKKMLLTTLAISCALATTARSVSAAGFQISEHSASGLGRAFAGEAAIADNAATLARNPASLSMLEGTQVSNGITYIDPDVQVEFKRNGTGEIVEEKSAAPHAFVPNAFMSHQLNDKFTIGFGSYADFGLASDYSDEVNEEFGAIAGDTAITVINLNTSLAYKINEHFSVGASGSILLAKAELNRYSSNSRLDQHNNIFASMEGQGIGFGYKVGGLYKLNENHRWGIAYTGASDVELEGKFTGVQLNTNKDTFDYVEDIDGELTLNLPSILEVSGYHQLTDQFAMHYSWIHMGWSSFEEILGTSVNGECSSKGENDNVCLQKTEDWKDSNRYALGATYQVNDNWAIRSGMAYDETPTDEHLTASIPDSNRIWYSAGMSYYTGQHAFDLGVTYLVGEDGTSAIEEGTEFRVTKSTAMLYAVQYSYTFE